jgi:hypothetical protein
MKRLLKLAFALAAGILLGQVVLGQTGHATENADSVTIRDFEKRVSAWLDFRKKIESNLPQLKATSSPEKISDHQRKLAGAIRDARKNAKEGDIFTPEIAAEIRRLISLAMKPDGKDIAASLQHAEPVQLRLRVNDSYPANVPLQSTPPSLLANLPHLPPDIEYRVAGRDLILLDAKANLVIDVMENVFS